MATLESVWRDNNSVSKSVCEALKKAFPETGDRAPIMLLASMIDTRREDLRWKRRRLVCELDSATSVGREFTRTKVSNFGELAASCSSLEETLYALEELFERTMGPDIVAFREAYAAE